MNVTPLKPVTPKGRPKLPKEQRRTEYVGVRLTPMELARLYSVSRLVRMNAGEFLRKMALG